MHRAAAAALTTLLFATLANAQSTPGPRRTDPLEHASVQASLAGKHTGYQSFLRKAGGTWAARFDEPAGFPDLIYGSGIPVGTGAIATMADAQARAEQILNTYPALWGAPIADLKLASAEKTGHLYVFTWDQTFSGLEVYRARVQIQVHEVGRVAAMTAGGVEIPKGFARTPKLTADDALAVVRVGKTLLAGDTVDVVDFVVFPKAMGGSMEPRLAFVVDVRQPSRKVFERVYVDGNTKEILEVKPDRYEVTDVKGQVTGMVITANSAIAAPVQVPLAGVTVNVAGVGTTVTDANGNYLITTGLSGPFNVSAGMVGPDYNIGTAQGSLLNLNVPTNSHTPGVETADLFFNNPSDQFGTAQTNAAYHLMLVRGYTEAHFPGYLGFVPQVVTVNETSTCNAFYDPSDKTIHFFAAGGGCNNTCYGNVLYHEYTHGTDDYYGGILSSSLSEGTSDMFAMYICDSPIIGQDFQTGSFLRTGENNTVWPGSNCGNDPHCVGEVFMGFSWQGRKKLIASLGTPAGIAVAEADFIGIMPANPNGSLNATTQVFLNDDNDGDLTNGTPHFADLVAAAVMKGLPTPTFIPIHITNQRYPDTCNQTQPYLIYATIVPDAPNVLSTMVVNYSIEGGASGSVPMTPTGVADEYVGSVPGQVGPVVISYSITATDTAFNSVTLPATTGDAFRFAVGRKTTLLFDNLESGAAGWTHGAISGTDDWQLGKPQTAGTNTYDPTAAFSGNNVWGNDLQLTGGNGLYPSNSENWVDSPSINASGHTGVRLRFQRWLTVDKGSSDQATIAVNGTQIFANPTVGQFIDKAWMSQDIAAPSGDNVASFKARWRVKTNFGTNLGGWNIDDIEVYALESTPVLTLNLGASSTTPPTGQTLTFNFSGTPNAFFEFLLSGGQGPVSADGYGVVPIDGGTLTPVLSGQLDGAGNFVLPIPVPFAPVLQGLKIWWVSYAIAPGALPQISNTVMTTFQ